MATALEAAIEAASQLDARTIAERAGFSYEESAEGARITGRFLGDEITLAVPGFTQVGGTPLPPHVLAIVVYHLATSGGAEPGGSWTTFTELPDGMFYVNAYRGYTGGTLVRAFENDLAAVRGAADALPTTVVDLPGDVAVAIDVMPLVPVAFVYWAGDEEFGPRADFLFDETAGCQLPTDCLAVCCSWITHRLVDAKPDPASGKEPSDE